MWVSRRVGDNTSVGCGGCLGLVVAVLATWAIIGVAAAAVAFVFWVVVVLVGAALAWIILWAVPVSLYRAFDEEYGARTAGALVAGSWVVLVLAFAAWIL